MQAALAAAIALAAITIATKNNLLEGARFCRAFSFSSLIVAAMQIGVFAT